MSDIPVRLGRGSFEGQIVVLGSGRSGTTALMEALAVGLDGAAIYEPLRPEGSSHARGLLPPHGYSALEAGEDVPGMREYWEGVLEGRMLTRWSLSSTTLSRLRRGRYLVVKEVRANRMAGWLECEFPTVGIVGVVRHPLPVIASMLRSSYGWSRFPYEWLVGPAGEHLGVDLESVVTREHPRSLWLACLWLADTLLLFRGLGVAAPLEDDPRVVRYEDLVDRPKRCLSTLAGSIPSLDVDCAIRSLKAPSRTASSVFGVARGADSLPRRELDAIYGLLRENGLEVGSMWPVPGHTL